MYVGFYSVRPLPLLLQLLPQTPPRTGRGRRLLLPLERHARCGPSLDLHIEGLVVAHLDPARALPPSARCTLLFRCSVSRRAHFVSSILSSSFTCFFVRMRGCGPWIVGSLCFAGQILYPQRLSNHSTIVALRVLLRGFLFSIIV